MRKIVFLGQRQIAWKALEVLARRENRQAFEVASLVTDAETYARAKHELQLAPRFISNDERRTEEIISSIRADGADLLISIQHNWILSKEVLDVVGGWAFNLHNARLPHYQGYNSISHAILNGDETFYSTIHWMEEKVDSGAIAFEGVTAISADDTALSLHRKTISSAISAFERLINALRSGASIPRHPLPADVCPRFYGRNSLKELVDVTSVRDLDRLDRLARALFYPPYNLAFKETENRKIYLVPQSGLVDLREVGFPLDR